MPNYPTSLDTLTNPTSADGLASPPHATQHADVNDIAEALETKLGTGASTPTTTGHVLTVTGAGATAYQAAAGGTAAVASTVPVTGQWIRPNQNSITTTTSTAAADTLYAIPLPILASTTVDRIALDVTTLAVGSARLGIYSSLSSGHPGALVLDAGTVDTGTTGLKEIIISQALSAGLHWTVVVYNAGPIVRAVATSASLLLLGGASFAGIDATHFRRTFTYGALPNPWGTPTTFSSSPPHLIGIRAA